MKVLVTGATGYIGKHVVAELIRRNYRVRVLVRPTSSHIKFFGNVVDYYIGDLENFNSDELFSGVDCLFHLAWEGLPNYGSRHHIDRNLPVSYNFIVRAIDNGIGSIIISGTCQEYGLKYGPIAARDICIPITAYGIAKNCLRQMVEYLCEYKKINLVWARLFYSYGEGQSNKSLLSQLKKAIDDKETEFPMSIGTQLRDYLPVEVLAKDLVERLDVKESIQICNICSGVPISVNDLVQSYLLKYGYNITLNRGKYQIPEYETMAFWGLKE